MKQTANGEAQRRITQPYPLFEGLEDLPWKPWVIEGVEYKLPSINGRSEGFTCLLRVAPNTKVPVHHHLGAIERIVLSGDFYYDKLNIGFTDDYMYEPASDIHEPKTDSGCVLFCVFEGPITGIDDDGSVAGIVDGKTMLDLATSHGVAGSVHA